MPPFLSFRKALITALVAALVNMASCFVVHAEDQKIRIKDSHGKWAFDAPPERIAVINWTLTEQLFELGVTPVAVADLAGFQAISPQTKLPTDKENLIDIGSRFEPRLAELKASKPDLIIIGYSQRDLLRPLSNIAPVMYFNNFSRRNNNSEKADERFLTLAKLFERTSMAKQKLLARDQEIATLKATLKKHYESNGKTLPKVTIASLKGDTTWAYLNNSMPYSVSKKLGLVPELEEKPSKLGTHKMNAKQLDNLQGCLIFINNESNESIQNLGKPSCKILATDTNAFGGAMSQLYLSQSITDALMR